MKLERQIWGERKYLRPTKGRRSVEKECGNGAKRDGTGSRRDDGTHKAEGLFYYFILLFGRWAAEDGLGYPFIIIIPNIII